VGEHRQTDDRLDNHPETVGQDHQSPAVEPIGQGATNQGEQEPGEALRRRHTGDGGRFAGQRGSQQRECRQANPVTQIRQRCRPPQPPEAGTETPRNTVCFPDGRYQGHCATADSKVRPGVA
jgi:hypothetical protein